MLAAVEALIGVWRGLIDYISTQSIALQAEPFFHLVWFWRTRKIDRVRSLFSIRCTLLRNTLESRPRRALGRAGSVVMISINLVPRVLSYPFLRSERGSLFVISQILGDTWPDPTRVSPQVGERTWERGCISLSIRRCLHSEKPVCREKTSSECDDFKSLTLTQFRFRPPPPPSGGYFVFRGIRGGGVLPGSPNPDPISDPKVGIFHTRVHTWCLKSVPISRPGVDRIYVILLRLEPQEKVFLKPTSSSHITLSDSFGIETTNTFIVHSLENHTRIQTKIDKSLYQLCTFLDQNGAKPIPFVAGHTYKANIRE